MRRVALLPSRPSLEMTEWRVALLPSRLSLEVTVWRGASALVNPRVG